MVKFDNRRAVNHIGSRYQSASDRNVKSGILQHAKSRVELTAENGELMRRIGQLENCIKAIMQKGVHIPESISQGEVKKIALSLRKEGQGGWLYFVEDGLPEL